MCMSETIHHSLYDMGWDMGSIGDPPRPPPQIQRTNEGGVLDGCGGCHISVEGVKHQLSTQQQQTNTLPFWELSPTHITFIHHTLTSQQHTKQRTSAKNAHNIFIHQHQHRNSTSSPYFISTTAPSSLSSFNFR